MDCSPQILVCDLDGTLIGGDRPRRLSIWLSKLPVPYVVATGRRHHDTLDRLRRHDLPLPDAIVSDVGSTVAWRHDAHYRLDSRWWYRHRVFPRTDIRDVIVGLIPPQPKTRQTAYKLSYYGSELDAGRVAALLEEHRLPARVMHSHERYIDVLPRTSGKGEATRYVCEMRQLDPSRAVAIGDSNNDRCMLEAVGMPALVANYADELADLARPPPDSPARVYVARHAASDGVIEAFEHYAGGSTLDPPNRGTSR